MIAVRVLPVLITLLFFPDILAFPHAAHAETRRALLIGIDRYDQGLSAAERGRSNEGGRSWHNLQGSVNDATAMREILVHRFGFREADIVLLTNEQATRAEILRHFQHHLIEAAQPGDLSIFFYAGHGSRIRNSNSTELDKKDETIVPADANMAHARNTIIDIRDKEWNRLFTQVLDKGARLTAIFDSCHSGSISRASVPTTAQVRFIDEDERDVATLIGAEPPAHAPGQEPEKRDGALIVSATQEDQQAREAMRRVGDRKEWHGAFTLALTETLNDLPANATAERVLNRVTAKLKAEGLQQDPVLAGVLGRRRAPLFGGETNADLPKLHLNVIQASGTHEVDLQGGLAVGLTTGTELVPSGPGARGGAVRLRVTDVRNLVRSQAAVIQGNWKTLKPGDEFEVIRWGAAAEDSLNIWLPPPVKDHREAQRLAAALQPLVRSSGATWVGDPTEQAPTHVLSWNGSEWLLTAPTGQTIRLGDAPTGKQVLAHLGNNHSSIRLFMNIPLASDLHAALSPGALASGNPVRIVRDPDEAHYVLLGRIVGRHIEHAWALRSFMPVSRGRAAAPMPLPARTAWGNETAGNVDCAEGGWRTCIPILAKLFHWLTIRSSGDDRRFPYDLAFKPVAGRTLVANGTLPEGAYRLVLEADAETIRNIQDTWGLQERYVYIFVIDQQGRSTLLFPNEASKEKEHLLPAPGFAKKSVQELTQLYVGDSGLINVHAPFGTDTYVLLTSVRPVPQIKELVESSEVTNSGKQMRGQSDWSISRRFLQSVPGT